MHLSVSMEMLTTRSWRRSTLAGLILLLGGMVSGLDEASDILDLGVSPIDEWTCPRSHPIKGNLSTDSSECIYHSVSSPYYSQTKPEVCFARELDARDFGCRAPRR